MEEYQYKPLNAEETRLLLDWEYFTKEPIQESRIKLKNPETREDFLNEIQQRVEQIRLTAKELFSTLQTVKIEDQTEKDHEFLQIEKEVLD
jgi:hypothetical protein